MQAAVVVGMMRGADFDDFGALKDGIDGIYICIIILVQQTQEDVGINDKIEVKRDRTKKVEASSLRGLKFQRKAPRKKELKVLYKIYFYFRRKNVKILWLEKIVQHLIL